MNNCERSAGQLNLFLNYVGINTSKICRNAHLTAQINNSDTIKTPIEKINCSCVNNDLNCEFESPNQKTFTAKIKNPYEIIPNWSRFWPDIIYSRTNLEVHGDNGFIKVRKYIF